ncbi:hypothetical protein P4571_25365 [Niallia alba]|nr:hypothetical protein [Niallia alba]
MYNLPEKYQTMEILPDDISNYEEGEKMVGNWITTIIQDSENGG